MVAPSLFSTADSSSPTSALPSLESVTISSSSDSSAAANGNGKGDDGDGDADSDAGSSTGSSEYVAPLGGHAPEPSIDGTSVGGGEGGVRAETPDQVGDEEKKVGACKWVIGPGCEDPPHLQDRGRSGSKIRWRHHREQVMPSHTVAKRIVDIHVSSHVHRADYRATPPLPLGRSSYQKRSKRAVFW